MPTYDFKCRNNQCDYFEELYLSIEDMDKPIKNPCPKCGEYTVERLFGSPVINLSYRGSTIQSDPKNRRFKETVLDPIKRGLGKTGRVNNIE